jgi:DNA polymerase-3 subunit alpha
MSTYFSLHTHSHASVLDGVSKPKDILNRITEIGLPGCAITDHGTVSEAFAFNKLFLEANKKPILGCEFYLSNDHPSIKTQKNRQLAHLVVLAKNKMGWQSLIKAVSFSNLKENFYYKPRLQLEQFSGFMGNLLCFSGHPGSQMANILFADPKLSYRANTTKEAEQLLVPDWYDKALELAQKHIEIFGKENFYLEIQLIDRENLPVQNVIADCLRKIGKKNNIPCVSTADAHYCRQEDAQDQRVLLCTMLKTNFKKIQRALDNDEEFGLSGFFKSNNYHIPSPQEMLANNTLEEISHTLEIAEKCETYSLSNTPFLPKFGIPKEHKDSNEYLTHLCRDGWRKKIIGCIAQEEQQKYVDRIKYEIGVISPYGLSDYFLIVQDYINWAKNHGILVGPSRGSCAGSLMCYLMNITEIDPIKYGLIFERFINPARLDKKKIDLPDIDSDFPIDDRHKVIEYIEHKYGIEQVAQICTFSKFKGRGALKDVLRAHDICGFEEMNKITEHIPDEAAIADELQEMKEDGEDPSIILWSLQNNQKELSEWCSIDEGGAIVGKYARYFKQAIRLEGTIKAMSKHASALFVSPVPLVDIVPMGHDKSSDRQIIYIDMRDAESLGILKLDCLGLSALSKLAEIQRNVSP